MSSENSEAKTIFRTRDYKLFRQLSGNRKVEQSRVDKVVKSIKDVGYVTSPICVNEYMEVIDGQARLAALQYLGMPVDYYIANGASLDECVSLNINQTNWGTMDYVDSQVELGNKSYVLFRSLLDKYPQFNLGIILNAVNSNRIAGHQLANVRRGDFFMDEEDFEYAVKILEFESKFVSTLKNRACNTRYYYEAIHFCYKNDNIDNRRLLENFHKYQAKLIPASNINQALSVLEDIYNYRYSNRVYITTEYRQFIDERTRRNKKKYRTLSGNSQ